MGRETLHTGEKKSNGLKRKQRAGDYKAEIYDQGWHTLTRHSKLIPNIITTESLLGSGKLPDSYSTVLC